LIHLSLKKNKFIEERHDGTNTTQEYISVTAGRIDTISRAGKQPYITFRLSLDNNQDVTTVKIEGKTIFAIILATLSEVGGLFGSISAGVVLLVGFITRPLLITHVSKYLFL